MIAGGQVAVGGSLSVTVTVKLQRAVWPEVSVAVQFTVVVPTANVAPEAGLQAMVEPGQLSEAVAV